jgi:hypothetical protein
MRGEIGAVFASQNDGHTRCDPAEGTPIGIYQYPSTAP